MRCKWLCVENSTTTMPSGFAEARPPLWRDPPMLAAFVQLLSFQPAPLAAPPSGRHAVPAARTAVRMQMDFLSKGLGGLKMPGMPGGDDMGLSKEEAEEMEARMKQGGMNFDDFLKQTQVMQKAGRPAVLRRGCSGARERFCHGRSARAIRPP